MKLRPISEATARVWFSLVAVAVCLLVFCCADVSGQELGARRPLAVAALPAGGEDLGVAAAGTRVGRMQLVLGRPALREAALETLIAGQMDPGSAMYRRWVTPSEFGERFGVSDVEVARLTGWLAGQGFDGVRVNAGRTVVEFSGTAGLVERAFGASLHKVNVGGTTLLRSAGGASIPAEFTGTVRGLASFSQAAQAAQVGTDLRREKATGVISAREPASGVHGNFTLGSNGTTYYAVTPGDFAAIYDLLPLYQAAIPVDGTGQTIAVVGDTDINPADFVAFRRLFGLAVGDTTTSTGTQYLNIIYNGPKPAVLADEWHANADTQWAGAAAQGAVIDYVASQTTEATAGVDLSAMYVVDNNLAGILVYGYGRCEGALGSSGSAFYKALWQQAAAEGIAVVTAAGDAGAAGCDAVHVSPAVGGLGVNGAASTPYGVAVGGTEFYAPHGMQQYFGGNSATYGSATGYIPETVWNDSCTNPAILATTYVGLTTEAACNSAASQNAGQSSAIGGGGGASSIYAKPSWQTGVGVPADGVRDVPDVALFGSQGRTNSFYVVCQSSRDTDGKGCNLDAPYADFSGYGGTELAAPSFAGILALAGQKTAVTNGGRLGNPGRVLYGLAGLQQASGISCNATGNTSAGCYFHDVTTGTNAMACVTGSPGCVTATAGDAYGALSGFTAGTGYDQASGLGSVDAANLVNAWSRVSAAATRPVLAIDPPSVVHGSVVTASVTVTGASPTGLVSFNSEAGNGSVGTAVLANGAASAGFRDFPGGTYGVRAHYEGDGANAAADSNFVSITVTPEDSATELRVLSYDPVSGTAAAVSAAAYGDIYYIRADVAGASGQGSATGNVAITDNGQILGSGVYRLNSGGYTEAQNNGLGVGTHVFAASYSGDASFRASSAAGASLTISRAATAASVTTDKTTVSQAGTVTLAAVIGTTSFGYAAPTGTVRFYSGATALGSAVLVAGSDAAYHRAGTATMSISAGVLALGTNAITVEYPGDANYLASDSGAASLGVTATTLAVTTTEVSASPATVQPGGTISFYTAVKTATGTPSGSVQFAVDGQNVGSPVVLTGALGGVNTTVAGLTQGFHTLVGVYSGDAKFRSSISAGFGFTVAAPATLGVPVFTANPTTLVQGTFISVAASVPNTAGVPTGTMQLVLDGGPYGGTVALSGGATLLPLPTTTLQVGKHVLTVYYAGDQNYSAAYGVPVTLTISAPGATPSAVALTGVGTQALVGSGLSFTAAVSPGAPVPTGIFEVIVDGGNPGAPVLLAGGGASLTVPGSLLGLGTHTVSVFYSGDATYNFSRSATSSFSVVSSIGNQGSFTISPVSATVVANRLTASPTLTYTVTPVGGFSGDVAFSCTGLPGNTACSFTPEPVTIGGGRAASTVLTIQLNTGLKTGGVVAAMLGFGALGMLWPGRRRVWRGAGMAMLVGMAGCGGGYAPGSSAPGMYTVVVTATSGGVVQTGTISLTVQ